MLTKLAAFNEWANLRMVRTLHSLPKELIHREIKSSFPSIATTILHICDGQVLWMSRINGTMPGDLPSHYFKGSTKNLFDLLMASSRSIVSSMSSLEKNQPGRLINYITTDGLQLQGKLDDLILNLITHGVYHRGQVITMLRTLDVTRLPETDFIVFSRAWSK